MLGQTFVYSPNFTFNLLQNLEKEISFSKQTETDKIVNAMRKARLK
jgi:hypothetical protein